MGGAVPIGPWLDGRRVLGTTTGEGRARARTRPPAPPSASSPRGRSPWPTAAGCMDPWRCPALARVARVVSWAGRRLFCCTAVLPDDVPGPTSLRAAGPQLPAPNRAAAPHLGQAGRRCSCATRRGTQVGPVAVGVARGEHVRHGQAATAHSAREPPRPCSRMRLWPRGCAVAVSRGFRSTPSAHTMIRCPAAQPAVCVCGGVRVWRCAGAAPGTVAGHGPGGRWPVASGRWLVAGDAGATGAARGRRVAVSAGSRHGLCRREKVGVGRCCRSWPLDVVAAPAPCGCRCSTRHAPAHAASGILRSCDLTAQRRVVHACALLLLARVAVFGTLTFRPFWGLAVLCVLAVLAGIAGGSAPMFWPSGLGPVF